MRQSSWRDRRSPVLVLDGDQAERCDGNLPFASCLMALLSMTGHRGGTGFVEGEIPFSAVAQTVGFSLRTAVKLTALVDVNLGRMV